MSLIKKLAGETVIYGLGSVLPRVISFVVMSIYLTRVFDELSYGVYGILYAYLAVLLYFFTFKMDTAFFRFATISDRKSAAFTTGVLAIFCSCIVLVPLIIFNAETIASVLNFDSDSARYIKWFALILAFDSLAMVPFAKLRLENKPLKFALIRVLNVIITITIIFFFLEVCPRIINSNPNSILASIYDENRKLDYVFIANVIASGCVLLMLVKEFFDFKYVFDFSLFKKMISYSWPLIIIGVAGAINITFDREFISQLGSGTAKENLAQSGIYNGSIKIAVLMSLFATAFNYAAEPFFFKSFKDKEPKEMYAKVALAYTVAASIAFVLMSLFLDVLQYLIGQNFRGAIKVVPILLLAYLFLGLYYNFSIWFKLKDKTIYGAAIAFSGLLLVIGMNVLLIPRIGYSGAAWSVLACFIFYCAAAYLTGQKHFPINYPIKKITSILILATTVVLVSIYLRSLVDSQFIRLGINSVLGLLYLIIIYWTNKNLVREVIGSN